MNAVLRSITRIRAGEYDVVFDVNDGSRTMRCTVAEVDGIRAVEGNPDLLCSLGVWPRLIAAAVGAFDACVRNEEVP